MEVTTAKVICTTKKTTNNAQNNGLFNSLAYLIQKYIKAITKEAPTVTIIQLGVVFIIIQALDGILTILGVSHLGLNAEGNFILRSIMETIGLFPAIIFTKTLAVIIICTLVFLANYVKWVENAFKVVISFYIIFAIIPWSYIIFTHIVI